MHPRANKTRKNCSLKPPGRVRVQHDKLWGSRTHLNIRFVHAPSQILLPRCVLLVFEESSKEFSETGSADATLHMTDPTAPSSCTSKLRSPVHPDPKQGHDNWFADTDPLIPPVVPHFVPCHKKYLARSSSGSIVCLHGEIPAFKGDCILVQLRTSNIQPALGSTKPP